MALNDFLQAACAVSCHPHVGTRVVVPKNPPPALAGLKEANPHVGRDA
jgi:hypothetical protein